jgi:hypothetical protein
MVEWFSTSNIAASDAEIPLSLFSVLFQRPEDRRKGKGISVSGRRVERPIFIVFHLLSSDALIFKGY